MVASSTFLVLLLAAFAAAAPGPGGPVHPVNNELEALVAKFNPDQKEAVASGRAELGKSGGDPLVPTKLETTVGRHQELEVVAEEGKQLSGLQTALPEDCGRNPRYERTNGKQDNSPWLIIMGKGRGKDFKLGCIGVVISSRHVISSALCVISSEIDVVVAATADDAKLIEVQGTRIVPDVNKAEDFLVGRNIAVVTLKTPLTFSEYIQPACLPGLFATADPEGRINNATVYGVQINNGDLDKFFVTVNAYGPAVFYSLLKDYNAENPREQVKSIELVATKHLGVVANFEVLKFSALFLRNENDGRFYVVGVGPVADNPKEPVTLYTSIVPHRRWIEIVVRQ